MDYLIKQIVVAELALLSRHVLKIVKTIVEIRNVISRFKKDGKSIALVPTMGCFHEGHLSLIRQAGRDCDVLVVSIFVNPAQFGTGEDYEYYPRDLKRDADLAEREKVDFIFAPGAEGMYPSGYAAFVEVEGLSKIMCGKTRPIHFRGVVTIVMKLFNLIQPDIAYFGQKDAQQAVIIRKMASDLNMNVEIRVLPIVREEDGLAMSSRNEYLSNEERRTATILHRALLRAKKEIAGGKRNAGEIKETMTEMLESERLARLDYIAIVDPKNLHEIASIDEPALIAVAVWFGKTRLIDNIIVNP